MEQLQTQLDKIKFYAPNPTGSRIVSPDDDRALLYALADIVKTLAAAAADHETRITTLENA